MKPQSSACGADMEEEYKDDADGMAYLTCTVDSN